MSALLELVVHVNNSRWPRVLLYLAARLTTVSLDDKEIMSIFVHRCNEKYAKEGKMNRSFSSWMIPRKRNLIAHF